MRRELMPSSRWPSASARWMPSMTCAKGTPRAPWAWVMIGSSPNSTPMAKIAVALIHAFASDAAASASTLTRPTIRVSTSPRSMVLSCVAATGIARATVRRIS